MPGDPGELRHRERLAARTWVHPSAAEDPSSLIRAAQRASAARSILRRCANAASTTANTSSRGTCGSGGGRRVKATRAESTLGTGQNTLRGTGPARRADAYQASLTDGTP